MTKIIIAFQREREKIIMTTYVVARWTQDSPRYGHTYLIRRGMWTHDITEARKFPEAIARNWAARLRNLFGARTWVVPVV